ncbi:MAG: PDZ domain-containing protein, partial [Candidatus Electrothrix sp. AR4]|nr:PDZ domain-containing protein [Candidatus Electrothrix sp. AR4]
NGDQSGLEEGSQADYLMFTEDVQLPPAGKIGVLLKEEEESNAQPAKVKISGISPLGKAGEAGLKKDDVITAVDNSQVSTIGDLKIALIDKKPGETVQLNIVRKDQVMKLKVELSDMEKAAAMPPGHPKK